MLSHFSALFLTFAELAALDKRYDRTKMEA